MFDLSAVQTAIRELGLDGWLLYDFRGMNVLARRVLGISDERFLSRRWFYFIPAQGVPKKLVHKIEPAALEHLPGTTTAYSRWQELEAGVAALTAGCKRVAMEYVPRNANPYVSRVDAGTVELVRSCGVEVVPSGDLVQWFEACWDDEQEKSHFAAAVHTRSAYDAAFGFIGGGRQGLGRSDHIVVSSQQLVQGSAGFVEKRSPGGIFGLLLEQGRASAGVQAHFAVIGPIQSRQEPQQRGFAHAVRPHQSDELTRVYRERDAVQDLRLVVAQREVFYLKQ